MDSAQDILSQVRDNLTVKRVFGEPYEAGGVTFVPVAHVRGGGGGGTGKRSADGGPRDGSGWGGGLGFRAEPAGAYVIRNGTVEWKPALDLTRIILRGQVVGIVALLTVRAIVHTLARRRRRR
jgi:uncharacterized spore protein YtfJ